MSKFVEYKESVSGVKITLNTDHIVAVIDDHRNTYIKIRTVDGQSYCVCRDINQKSADEIYESLFE